MAKCAICGKGPNFGHNVSHANNRTKKVWMPNIQRVKTVSNGTVRHVRVCTQCIKSGR
ncbi:MAG: 50S ribosomal protein L28, partial [Deltaproteobacteria bacterium]